jgi:hypothetical protein
VSSTESNIDGFVNADQGSAKGGTVEMVIGFNADYAVFVHEILDEQSPGGAGEVLGGGAAAGREDFLRKAIAHHAANVKGQVAPAVIDGVRDCGLQCIDVAMQLAGGHRGDAVAHAREPTGFLVASATTRPAEVK